MRIEFRLQTQYS